MAEFSRDRLPDPLSFFESEGLTLKGSGKWRSTQCVFHGGSSMRINTESGAWVCMSCHEKGGDVLAYAMRRHGLEFIEAARMLGAFIDDNKPYIGPNKPTTLPARDAMEAAAFELLVAVQVIAGIRRGEISTDDDWLRFLRYAYTPTPPYTSSHPRLAPRPDSASAVPLGQG